MPYLCLTFTERSWTKFLVIITNTPKLHSFHQSKKTKTPNATPVKLVALSQLSLRRYNLRLVIKLTSIHYLPYKNNRYYHP